jgi:hypothetical protein
MYVPTNTQTSNGWRPQSLRLGSWVPTRPRPGGRPRRLRRRGFLGQLTDQDILTQVFAGQSGSPAADNVRQVVQTAVDQGALYTAENCSGIVGPSTAQLVTNYAGVGAGAAGSIGSALAIAGIATGPLMPIVALAGGIISLFGAIFGAHAAKVKQEQQIICAVVQSVNDSLSVIDQAVRQGQLSPAQANGSLDQMYSELKQAVQPILKQDSGHCNAACFILAEARGVIIKRKDLYSRIMPAGAPAGSWQQTCRNVVVNGDTFTAECEDTAGNWDPTSIPSIAACSGAEIANINGVLKCCDPNRPAGSTVCNPWTPATAAVSASGAPIVDPSSLVSQAENLVASAASSTGLPAWGIWAGVGLLLVGLLKG